jgi:hypothetical protein
MDDAFARIGCGLAQADIGPGLQVLDGVDDTTAELAVARTGAVRSMFLQGASGQAQQAGRLRRAQIALGGRKFVGHEVASAVNRPSLLIDGVTGAASRISGGDEDDEDEAAKTVHPLCLLLPLIGPSAPAKQIAIAAAHTADGVFYDADDLCPARGCQPFTTGLGADIRIEQCCCDIAIAGVLVPAVKCPQHEDQAAALLCGNWHNRRGRRSHQLLP